MEVVCDVIPEWPGIQRGVLIPISSAMMGDGCEMLRRCWQEPIVLPLRLSFSSLP
jgi:hypothetical protein